MLKGAEVVERQFKKQNKSKLGDHSPRAEFVVDF